MSRARPGELQRLAAIFRRALLRRERIAADEMVRAYGVAWRRIEARLQALLDEMEKVAVGPTALAWLFERERMQMLQRQVEAEWRRWAADSARRVAQEQRAAVQAAGQEAEALTRAALGSPPPGVTLTWARLSREALEDLVGFASDGTPLRALLDALGVEASQAVREALIAGIATGENPRSIARRVRGEFSGSLARALRVARTETLRAYRSAALRNYRANDDVVRGWIWLAAVQGRGAGRTCSACWAMHGTTHSLDEIMDDHPNGRCAAAPWVRSWAELGFEGLPEQPDVPQGVELFSRLTPQEQDRVLGVAGGAAYRAGAVKLEQFVGVRYSARWGSLRYARGLTSVLGREEAEKWAKAGREIPWGDWAPAHADAKLVGVFGEALRTVVGKRAGVRQVYVVRGTLEHYHGRHGSQIDLTHAEDLLSQVIADPMALYQGIHKNSLVLIGLYDEDHYLIVPIKTLPGELWLSSVYIDRVDRFYKRAWVKRGLLYKKRQ